MATIFIPTPQGGRAARKVSSGTSVAAALRSFGFVNAGARFGVEKRVGTLWERTDLGYLLKEGDLVRVAMPAQQSAAGHPLAEWLSQLLGNLVRKERKKRKK